MKYITNAGAFMNITEIENEKMKKLFKESLLEVISENKDLFQDIFSEAIEDIALSEAIKEGANSKKVDRSEVLKVLEHEK
ncbi:hypothetical protein [Flexistipes sp.]|uniref:hypothetical protein n=1 Tax=Flexistipes sp. TaxID=3088135 RepID=UPI002E209211|nr:hypothetical protein [Flexistipes sp.]